MPRPASLPPLELHQRFHVVLVEPGDSLNVGSVARAMMNLDFSHLHLVAPPRYDPAQAAVTACWAEGMLKKAHLHPDLPSALDSMEDVVGFTARHGKNRPQHLLLPDWTERLAGQAVGKTALVFGPEDGGLRNEHLAHCHWLVRLPSSEANPSYNLAQAVLLVLFEMSRAHWKKTPTVARQMPPARDFYQLEALVEEALIRARFFHQGTPAHVPGLVNHMLRRMEPDAREMRILLGMFGKIGRALSGKVPTAPLPEKDEPG